MRPHPHPPLIHSPSYLFLDPDDVSAAGETGGPPKSPLMAGVSSAFSLVRKVSKKVSKPKQGRIEGTDKRILKDLRDVRLLVEELSLPRLRM